MLQSSPSDPGLSIPFIEGSLTLIAVAASFAWPRLGDGWFVRLERAFGKLARRRRLSVALVGLSVVLLRLALLPLLPIPLPFVPDDFGFLLAADTFAHGHLTNPTPAMWVHFESIQIDMKPTYMSMYFPGPGLVLAAGKVLFGHPWYGLLIANALMCAAICWMLQTWLPATWALLGGMIAVLHISLFSYWINTYHGGGAIAALGGALVLGAMPRIKRQALFRHAMLMALGIVLLIYTRPYEGMLLCLPVAAVLGHWLFKGKNRPNAAILVRRTAAPLALLIIAAAWLGYYDYRAFGSPFTLPYTVNRATYARVPYYIWQPLRPEPNYHHQELRRFYDYVELDTYTRVSSLPGTVGTLPIKLLGGLLFFAGLALMPPIIMFRRVLLDRRVRFLVLCVPLLMAGMSIEVFLIPHYLAPFTGAFYAIGLQAMRHLRVWRPGGQPTGATIVRLCVALCLMLAVIRSFDRPLRFPIQEWPPAEWALGWYGPDHFGVQRAGVEHILEQLPGLQLVLVRYSPKHNPYDEWVYNAADIDHSKVIWAREMDDASNRELLHYYKNRTAWLVQPDNQSAIVTPDPLTKQVITER
jgi:hypothetical protein